MIRKSEDSSIWFKTSKLWRYFAGPRVAFAEFKPRRPILQPIIEEPGHDFAMQSTTNQSIAVISHETPDVNIDTVRTGQDYNDDNSAPARIQHTGSKSREAFNELTNSEPMPDMPFGVFTFANGKQPKITATGMAAARKLLSEDIDITAGTNTESFPKHSDLLPIKQAESSQLDQQDLTKSLTANLMPGLEFNSITQQAGLLNTSAISSRNREVVPHEVKSDLPNPGMFQLANGKPVKISSTATAAAQSLFADIDNGTASEVKQSEEIRPNGDALHSNSGVLESESEGYDALGSHGFELAVCREAQPCTVTPVSIEEPVPSKIVGEARVAQTSQPGSDSHGIRDIIMRDDGQEKGALEPMIATTNCEQLDYAEKTQEDKHQVIPAFSFASGKPLEISSAAKSKAQRLMMDWSENNAEVSKCKHCLCRTNSPLIVIYCWSVLLNALNTLYFYILLRRNTIKAASASLNDICRIWLWFNVSELASHRHLWPCALKESKKCFLVVLSGSLKTNSPKLQ